MTFFQILYVMLKGKKLIFVSSQQQSQKPNEMLVLQNLLDPLLEFTGDIFLGLVKVSPI